MATNATQLPAVNDPSHGLVAGREGNGPEQPELDLVRTDLRQMVADYAGRVKQAMQESPEGASRSCPSGNALVVEALVDEAMRLHDAIHEHASIWGERVDSGRRPMNWDEARLVQELIILWVDATNPVLAAVERGIENLVSHQESRFEVEHRHWRFEARADLRQLEQAFQRMNAPAPHVQQRGPSHVGG